MCGIAGFSLSEQDLLTTNTKRLSRELLLGIESRGRDATGIAFLDSTGGFQVHKTDQPASAFVKRRLAMPRHQHSAVLHTRAATQGRPEYNVNNHPIIHGSLVGVHNGMIWNDEWLWDRVVDRSRRYAEVDSEVIFAMLAHGQADSGASVKDALEELCGSAAIAWLDQQTPDRLYLARVDYSPLIVVQTEGGSTVFASTQYAAEKACSAVGLEPRMVRDIDEGRLLVVERGDIIDVQTFQPQESYRGYGNYRSSATAVASRSLTDPYDPLAEHTSHQSSFADSYKSAAESAKVFLANGECVLPLHEVDWWSPEWMSKGLFDVTKEPHALDPDDFSEEYAGREILVEAWMQGFRGSYDQMTKAAVRLHAFTRPGDPIITDLCGHKVSGEVAEVPATWPTGLYLLRLWVGRKTVEASLADSDIVLVQRHFSQFEALGKKAEPKTVSANIALTA